MIRILSLHFARFQAQSDDEMEQWITALEKAVLYGLEEANPFTATTSQTCNVSTL